MLGTAVLTGVPFISRVDVDPFHSWHTELAGRADQCLWRTVAQQELVLMVSSGLEPGLGIDVLD